MEIIISLSNTPENEAYRRQHMPVPGKEYNLSLLKGSGKGYWADMGRVHIGSIINGILNFMRVGADDDERVQHIRAETIPTQALFSS